MRVHARVHGVSSVFLKGVGCHGDNRRHRFFEIRKGTDSSGRLIAVHLRHLDIHQASGELDGAPFGWNIGYGFGNTSAATENVLFYDGKIHKLGEVKFEIPMDEDGFEDFMKPWVFTSDDNRFYMNFTPVLDRSAFMSAGVVLSDQHQVFGHFTGRITLDDGTVLPVRDFFGFAEKVENKW